MVTLTHHDVVEEFRHLVNIKRGELEIWLQSPESKSVGQHARAGDESVGHRSGRRIVGLLQRNQFDDDDIEHMRTVIGFIHRHLAQRPRGDVRDTAWRFSLMNWGHDPLLDRH